VCCVVCCLIKRSLMESRIKRLNVVIVSDIHGRIDRIQQLLEWLARDDDEPGGRVPVTDLLLVAGDIANRNMHAADSDEPETIAKTTASMSFVLAELENICARLVYVPGNHDSPETYKEPLPHLTLHSCNAHAKQIRVYPDVVVVGLGGSTPAEYLDRPLQWSAYPFSSDEELNAALESTLKAEFPKEGEEKATGGADEDAKKVQKILDSANTSLKSVPHPIQSAEERIDPEKDLCILLTHQGPHLSTTTVDHLMGPWGPIYSGSHSISTALEKGPYTFQLAVHGHTHNARGVSIMPRGTIQINPGALCEGNFATCTLVKRPDARFWTVENVQLQSLPPLPVASEIKV